MKKLLLFLTLTSTSIYVHSQTLWSEGFENWSIITGSSIEDPNNWFTSNIYQSIFGDPGSVIKSDDSHSGQFAAKLMVPPSNSGDLMGGFINYTGEISGRPYFFTGWHKYNLASDTMQMVAGMMKWNGVESASSMMGACSGTVSGASSEFTYFSYQIDYLGSEIPDSIVVLFAFGDDVLSLNSTYIVDDLSLQIASSTLDLEQSIIPVYPNPSEGRFSMHLPSVAGILRIYDNAGRLNREFNQDASFPISIVDISNENDGFYHAVFIDEKGRTSTQKLIVQNRGR